LILGAVLIVKTPQTYKINTQNPNKTEVWKNPQNTFVEKMEEKRNG